MYLKKERDKKTKENEMKLKGENPQDIRNFDALVNLMLKNGNVQSIDIPKGVFGESFKTFLMKKDMIMIILFTRVSVNCIIFYIW